MWSQRTISHQSTSKQKERPRVRSGIYFPPQLPYSISTYHPNPLARICNCPPAILANLPSPQLPSSNNPPRTRSNPHSTRIPPHTRSNNTASPDRPSSSRDPSFAWAAGLVGTAAVVVAGSTFAAGEEGRRIASGVLVGIGLVVGRSWGGC